MNKLLIIYLAVSLGCAFNYCLAGESGDNTNLTDTLEAAIGEEFVITLDSNKTTGYEWRLAAPPDSSLVEFMRSEYVPGPANLIGAGGIEAWTFKAVKKGKATIYFEYVRPWEKDAPAVKKEEVIVIIH